MQSFKNSGQRWRFFADLHIHSRFSRATSQAMTIPALSSWAARKGVAVLGTGDGLHPLWLAELEENLAETGDGVYSLKGNSLEGGTRFIVQGEVSCIFKDAGRTRRVHLVVLFHSLESAKKTSASLSGEFNLASDGRPILKMHAKEFLSRLLDTTPGSTVIPAHIWTPWYSLLGERTGYSSVEECFGDLTSYIPALETGLSADPAMARRVSSLDRFGLVSFSDAHSPRVIGREACEFEMAEISFPAIVSSMRPGDARFISTVEFHPEEGKYFLGGHRKCGVTMSLEEASETGGLCPVCGKKMTGGVEWRVGELADRKEGKADRPFRRLMPLAEIVAGALGYGALSVRTARVCDSLTAEIGPELYLLLDAGLSEVAAVAGERVAQGLALARAGEVAISPGYDGEFGRVSLFPAR